MRFSPSELRVIELLAGLIASNPAVLHMKELVPLRDVMVGLGARIPMPNPVDLDDEPIDVGPVGLDYVAPPPRDDVDEEAAAERKAEAIRLFEDDDLVGAINAMTDALRANPNSAMTWAARADFYLKQGSIAEARADADVAVGLNADNARALRVLGRCCAKQRQWEEAAEKLNAAQRIDFKEDIAELLKVVQPKAIARREAAKKKEASRPAPAPPAAPDEFPMPPLAPPGLEDLFAALSNDPETMQAMQDPVVLRKLAEIQSNPRAVMSMMADPVTGPILSKIMSRFAATGGGFGVPPSTSAKSKAGAASPHQANPEQPHLSSARDNLD